MLLILRFLLNMLPYVLVSLPLIIFYRLIRLAFFKRQNITTTPWHEFGLCFFIVFLVSLASQTILCEFSNNKIFTFSLSFETINLIPFKVFVDSYREFFYNNNPAYFIINFIGNIVIFIPLGLFPPLLWYNFSLKKVIFIAFSSSLFIEISQLWIGRETDIDDILLNTFGGLLGYLFFKLLNQYFSSFTAKFKLM